PRVRVETTLDVPGHPELWQVLARLDASVPPGQLGPFLQAVSGGMPWIQVERLDLSTTAEGQRLVMTARAYYRKSSGEEGPFNSGTAAGAGHADGTVASGETGP